MGCDQSKEKGGRAEQKVPPSGHTDAVHLYDMGWASVYGDYLSKTSRL